MICSVIYRSSHTSVVKFLSEYEEYSSILLQAARTDDICIVGDFNINLIAERNKIVANFLNILYSGFLFLMIFRPSRITPRSCILIDNIFINNPLVTKCGLIFVIFQIIFLFFLLFLWKIDD